MNLKSGNTSRVVGFIIQLIGWVTILVVFPMGWRENWPEVFWVKQSILLVLLMVLYYINSLVLVPNLLLRNKTYSYFGAVVLSIIIVLAFMQLMEIWLHVSEAIHRSFNPDKPFKQKSIWRFDLFLFLLTLLVFGISTSVTLITYHNREKESRQAFEKQKISTELASLKSQINPHFYFNTLNSIYALVAINSKLAQKAIHMLSKMMRYVLYDSQKKEVLLSQEIAFIENYIELMRLRLTDKVEVIFTKPTQVENVLIAPMLFMPFVENAFKHGIKPSGNCQIRIEIDQIENDISLQVENEIFEYEGMDIERDKGIGLTNTKRRLELLYPTDHSLLIKKDNGNHLVELRLVLEKGA